MLGHYIYRYYSQQSFNGIRVIYFSNFSSNVSIFAEKVAAGEYPGQTDKCRPLAVQLAYERCDLHAHHDGPDGLLSAHFGGHAGPADQTYICGYSGRLFLADHHRVSVG